MNTTDRQMTFSALSSLLSYPDEEWRAEIPDWKALIHDSRWLLGITKRSSYLAIASSRYISPICCSVKPTPEISSGSIDLFVCTALIYWRASI